VGVNCVILLIVGYQIGGGRNYLGRVAGTSPQRVACGDAVLWRRGNREAAPFHVHINKGGPIMVRLLEKFWGAKNRIADAPRLGAVTQPRPPTDRALTLPALRKPRPSCRLQLEPLEDRLTPSVDFIPITHVALNPTPLPPILLVDFNAQPSFGHEGSDSWVQHVVGAEFQTLNLLAPIGATSSAQPWTLETIYSMVASGTENLVPPGALNAGSYSATFNLAGTVTEILAPVNPTTGATWVFNGTISQQGSISGALNIPSPIAPAVDTLMWSSQSTENGTFVQFTFGTVFTTQVPWQEQSQNNSQGSVMELVSPAAGLTLSATFMQQDVVTACFMPAPSPFLPPGPCITVNAMFNAVGAINFVPESGQPLGFLDNGGSGTTLYTDSLTENIMFADGSVRFFTENSQNSGIFIIAILVG
jgi:hypothetical protein